MVVAATELQREKSGPRKRQVERCLAAHGLKARAFPRRLGTDDSADAAGRRWRQALAELGPVFTALGLHLARRRDLLCYEARHELRALYDRGEATPPHRVRELIHRESAGVLEHLETEPFRCRLFSQSHHARLASGEPAVVKVVHPEVAECVAADVELLALLEPALSRLTVSAEARSALAETLAGFGRAVGEELDLLAEADALAVLARRRPAAPQVELARARVLVRTASGASLEELSDRRRGRDLARGLWREWLQLVLAGGVFPVEPRPADVALAADGRLAFTGGVFASPWPRFQERLWEYLEASAEQDPDRACKAMLREASGRSAEHADELRRRFRQILPVRDGGADVRGDHLADYLLLHWQLAGARGFRPRPLLLAFFRGLDRVHETARRLDPEGDGLRETLEELRVERELGELRRAVAPGRLGDDLRQYAALMADLPRKLDAALELAARGSLRLKLELVEGRRERRRGERPAALSLVTLLLAVLLLARHLADPTAAGPWAERLAAAVLLVAGGWLFGRLGRPR